MASQDAEENQIAHAKLNQPCLVPMIKAEEFSLNQQQNMPEKDRKNAKMKNLINLSHQISNETNNSLELFSLKDIILDRDPQICGQEPFFMLSDEPDEDLNSSDTALILKRTKLRFNGKRCIVLNF